MSNAPSQLDEKGVSNDPMFRKISDFLDRRFLSPDSSVRAAIHGAYHIKVGLQKLAHGNLEGSKAECRRAMEQFRKVNLTFGVLIRLGFAGVHFGRHSNGVWFLGVDIGPAFRLIGGLSLLAVASADLSWTPRTSKVSVSASVNSGASVGSRRLCCFAALPIRDWSREFDMPESERRV
jgi:hypothetical protein